MNCGTCSTNSLVIFSRTGMHTYLFKKIAFAVSVSPEDIHPSFVRMNELYQQDVLSERKSLHFQEIVDLFSSFFGGISADPIRGMKSLHQLFPPAVLKQEPIREAVSGRQAYNIYLGKHNVGKILKCLMVQFPFPIQTQSITLICPVPVGTIKLLCHSSVSVVLL